MLYGVYIYIYVSCIHIYIYIHTFVQWFHYPIFFHIKPTLSHPRIEPLVERLLTCHGEELAEKDNALRLRAETQLGAGSPWPVENLGIWGCVLWAKVGGFLVDFVVGTFLRTKLGFYKKLKTFSRWLAWDFRPTFWWGGCFLRIYCDVQFN